MEKFLKENWFKVSLLLLLAIFAFVYNRNVSVSELYKINSDCAEKASSFAKRYEETKIDIFGNADVDI